MLVLLTLYHAFFALFGLDLSDEGFYMTFYANIFDHPETVEYNFMFYLTGVMGGGFLKLFPSTGLLAMRWLGIAVIIASAVLVFATLRHRVGIKAIMWGLALVVLGYINRPYAFGNSMNTAMFYALAFLLLYNGIDKKQWQWTLLAGIACGLNVFVRIPNILTVFLVAILVIAGVLRLLSWKQVTAHTVSFIGGMVLGIISVILIQFPLNHHEPFVRNISQLFSIFTVTDNSASHSSSFLVVTQLRFFFDCLIRLAIFGLLVLLNTACRRWLPIWLCRLVQACLLLAAVLLMWRTQNVCLLWCLSMTGCGSLIVKERDGWLRLLSLMGLSMLLLFPCGSDAANNQGTLIALVSTPMAIVGLKYWRELKIALILLAMVFVAKMFVAGSFLEAEAFYTKTGIVHHERLAGIHTQRQRANALNDGLTSLKTHVTPGDTLLVIGNSPMINYLTETLPYHGNSWPGLLNEPMLRKFLDGGKPKILIQKYRNGDYWSPRPYKNLDQNFIDESYVHDTKMIAVHEFILGNHYHNSTETEFYVLFEP